MIISSPSWVMPGTYLENLAVLEELRAVESVELLFYIYDEETRSLFKRERDRIASWVDRFGFTVHLPDPLLPEHEELVEATRDFVGGYVFHPGLGDSAQSLSLTIGQWKERYGDVFLLENTRLEIFDANLPRFGDIGICCDVGHLLVEGVDPAEWIARHEGRVRELHLHGLSKGRDHAAFSLQDTRSTNLVPFLKRFSGVVEIEVFAIEELRRSISELEGACGI